MHDHDRLARIARTIAVERAMREALDRIMEEKFNARDRAIEVVATESERIQAQQNEWRGALSDLSSTKISREEYEHAHASLQAEVSGLRDAVNATNASLAGQTGSASGTMRIFLVGAVMISLAGLIVTMVHLISG